MESNTFSLGAFSSYIVQEEDKYYVKLPNQGNAVLVKVGTEPTEHSHSKCI